MRKRKGFTLTELIVALGIIIFLGSTLMGLLQYSLVFGAKVIFTQANAYNLRTAAASITDNLRGGVENYSISLDRSSIEIFTYSGDSYVIKVVDGVLKADGSTPQLFIPVEMKSMQIMTGSDADELRFVLESLNGVFMTIESTIARTRN